MLRAKALECISLVGMAVGKDRFKADAQNVMQYMQAVQSAGLDPDDPFASYMLQAGTRFCSTLGDDYIQYLPIMVPPLLAAAQLQAEIKVKDADESEEEDEDDGEVRLDSVLRTVLYMVLY